MGNIFVGKVLMSMFEQPGQRRVDDELDPIQPGAWAAWAKSHADAQGAPPRLGRTVGGASAQLARRRRPSASSTTR